MREHRGRGEAWEGFPNKILQRRLNIRGKGRAKGTESLASQKEVLG